MIKRWKKSPLRFIEDIWKLTPQPLKKGISSDLPADQYKKEHFEDFVLGKHLTWQQWLFFRAIELGLQKKAPLNISVTSGHGTAKSTNMSFLIFWGLCSFIDAQIPCTAPTSDQLYDVLWKEAAKWQRKMPKQLADLFEMQSQYIRVKERAETWWARARTARKEAPEALAGVHGDVVIILVDEASGVPEEIFEVAQGALTGKIVIFVMVSNPTRLSGYFFDSQHKNSKNWQCLRFSSEDSPIVEPEYCERIIEQYGKDSPQYSIRVLGNFPMSEEDQFIPTDLFDLAVQREIGRDSSYKRILGVDVAAFGDDQCAYTDRQGDYMEFMGDRRGQDTMATCGDIVNFIKTGVIERNPFDVIAIDVIGVGRGVYDRLYELQRLGEIPRLTLLLEVNVSEKPFNDKEFVNRTAELWSLAKYWLKTGKIPEKYRADFCSRKYSFDSRGRLFLEKKSDMKSRGLASPDRGDSAVITFAAPTGFREKIQQRSRNESRVDAFEV